MYNTHIRIAIALALLSLFYCAKTLVFYWNIGSIIHITCRKTLSYEAHYQYIKDPFILCAYTATADISLRYRIVIHCFVC